LILNDLWIFIWLETIHPRTARHNLCLLESRSKCDVIIS
jgi:hypothetical protein